MRVRSPLLKQQFTAVPIPPSPRTVRGRTVNLGFKCAFLDFSRPYRCRSLSRHLRTSAMRHLSVLRRRMPRRFPGLFRFHDCSFHLPGSPVWGGTDSSSGRRPSRPFERYVSSATGCCISVLCVTSNLSVVAAASQESFRHGAPDLASAPSCLSAFIVQQRVASAGRGNPVGGVLRCEQLPAQLHTRSR